MLEQTATDWIRTRIDAAGPVPSHVARASDLLQRLWFSRSERFWTAANAASLLILSIVLFRLQAPVTFFRYDGTYVLALAKNQAEWMPALGGFTMDFLKGIGGPWFQIDTRLMPGFIVGLLGGDGVWLPALAATWFAAEFAVATVVLARVLGVRIPVSVLAVWIALFPALPYLVPTLTMERLWGNPHILSFIAYSTIALSLFLLIGRGARGQSLWMTGGIMVLLTYLTLAAPLSAVLVLPMLGFFGAVGLTMAETRRELLWKLGAAAAIAVAFFALFGTWLAGLFLYAKTTFYWSEMWPSSIGWRWVSLLVEYPARRVGAVILAAAIAGGILTARTAPSRRLRRFALGYLVFVALLWAITGFIIVSGINWPGPPISYVDFMIYPLHSLFAANLLYATMLRLCRSMRVGVPVPALAMLAAAVLPWAALASWKAPYEKPLLKNEIPFRWPPLRTPIVDLLEQEIGLRPGAPFRGRVVNLAGARSSTEYLRLPFINQHNYDAMVAFFLGNDHHEYGLWFYGVPTLEDSNQVTSPFFHTVMARLLNPENVFFTRAHETAVLFRPDLLAQLGVRYVITGQPLANYRPLREIEFVAGRTLYLSELPDPNVSGRAATTATVAPNAADALAQLGAADMDFAHRVVLFEPLSPGPLTPVSRSELLVERGFLSISAEAPGRALLVLPVEFSRCLEFTWTVRGAEPPRIMRANMDQTAILFTGRIEGRIAYRTGPLVNPTCRMEDLRDAVRLELGRTARNPSPPGVPPP
jgi:hypothetical protein